MSLLLFVRNSKVRGLGGPDDKIFVRKFKIITIYSTVGVMEQVHTHRHYAVISHRHAILQVLVAVLSPARPIFSPMDVYMWGLW
jgi:hypothetical protein